MLNKVVEVKAVAPHVLRITFADGHSGVHDFVAMVNEGGQMVEPLRDPAYFARVFLEYGALTWPNGFDLCPDSLRMEMDRDGAVMSLAAASLSRPR